MKGFTTQIKFIATIIVAALVVSSCFKDDDVLSFNNTSMVTIKDGKIISDPGSVFNVVQGPAASEVPMSGRALFICDVLRSTKGGADGEYDISLKQVFPANIKEVTRESGLSAEQESLLGSDPIAIARTPVKPLISGGYLNMFITIETKKVDPKKHILGVLWHDDITEKISLELKHEAAGETIASMPGDQLTLRTALISIPLNSVTQNAPNKIRLEVSTSWYVSDNPATGDGSVRDYVISTDIYPNGPVLMTF